MRDDNAGVNQICRLLGISKDSYYNSISPLDTLNNRYAHLKPKINQIIKSNPSYVYPRIKKALEDVYGITINHKTLLKLLNLWNLSLRRNIKQRKMSFVSKTLEFLGIRANILRSMLLSGKSVDCFEVVVSDITQIRYATGIAYLCVHMDYAGKYVYGYSLSMNTDTKLIIRSLKLALNRLKRFGLRDYDKLIFHQDRGSVYTSNLYVATVLSLGSILSYSRKGEPGDNAVNESFFSRFKEENRDLFSEAETFENLEKMICKQIRYHNEKRYHSSLKLISPLSYTKLKAQKLSYSK